MCRGANAPEAYQDVRFIEVQDKTVTDNAKGLTGVRWTNINRQYCIETILTVPHQQQQNHAEGMDGNFKFSVTKLFHNTPHTPYAYWCFAANFLDKTRRYLSKKTLGGIVGMSSLRVKLEM